MTKVDYFGRLGIMIVNFRIENSKKVYTMRLNVDNRAVAGIILQKALKKRVQVIYLREENETDRERKGNL